MNQNVYVRLQEFLDELPGGFPSTDSGVEIKILKMLFTPEEARLTLNLREGPEEVSAIAKRAGMDQSEAAEMLEVNQARCIGCGLCLSACPDEAIEFLEVPTAEVPPADLEEMRTRIRQERGLV
jgi:NAD-dependent dihydropyrimidine dehydrogenase PreA subunit